MQDVMLDLETWGTAPGCMIRSVGAVFFSPETGDLGDEFYCNVEEKSCKKLKMFKDQSTVDWWAQPNNALANKMLANDQLPIDQVVGRFTDFFRRGGRKIWSQGSNFDEPLLAWTYRALNMKQPWDFYNARDTRTIYDVAGLYTKSVKREGTYHNALDDAKHQALCVSMSYKRLRGNLV